MNIYVTHYGNSLLLRGLSIFCVEKSVAKAKRVCKRRKAIPKITLLFIKYQTVFSDFNGTNFGLLTHRN